MSLGIGRWTLTVDAENTDPGYDCSLIVGVDVALPSPLTFGEHIDIDLAAASGLPHVLARGPAGHRQLEEDGGLAKLRAIGGQA